MSKTPKKYVVVIVAQCPSCGYKREIQANEIAPGEHPLCPSDGTPLIAKQAKTKRTN